MALLVEDRIDVADLGLASEPTLAIESPQPGQASLQDYLDAMEKQAILDALEKTRFNRTAAARLLGVTFRSLRYRIQRLGLND
jgi:two-component system response regulator PilR (NtrC family)